MELVHKFVSYSLKRDGNEKKDFRGYEEIYILLDKAKHFSLSRVFQLECPECFITVPYTA